MPSDDSTVATQADFVPMAVGNTDRVRSVVSVSAHDGFSHQPRSGMQQGRLSVLGPDTQYCPDRREDWVTGVAVVIGQNPEHINDFYEGRFWL